MREATTSSKVDYFRLPRPLWRKLKKHLPTKKRKSKLGGRPRVSDRAVANAIWYVLWTGCQWKAPAKNVVTHVARNSTSGRTTLGGNAWERAGAIWYAAITGDIKADCDFATFAGAVAIGVVAGAVCAWAVGLKYTLGYDDSLDVVAAHGVGGTVGALLTAEKGSAGRVLLGDEAALRAGWVESVGERAPGELYIGVPVEGPYKPNHYRY